MEKSESKIIKTNCVFVKGRVVACEDYILANGKKSFACCRSCGWNPKVAQRRIKEIREERGMVV